MKPNTIILLFIYVLSNTIIQFTANAQENAPFVPVAATGLPYNIVISSVTLDNDTLPQGSQIGIFDDALCVGAVFYEVATTQLVAWEGDPTQSLPGFETGNAMIFKVRTWIGMDTLVLDAVPSYTQGDGFFGTGLFSVVDLTVSSGTVGWYEQKKVISDISIYPNPFIDKLNISLMLENDANVNIEMYDQIGKLIDETMIAHAMNKRNFQIKVDAVRNLPQGIYFLHVRSLNEIDVFKLIKF